MLEPSPPAAYRVPGRGPCRSTGRHRARPRLRVVATLALAIAGVAGASAGDPSCALQTLSYASLPEQPDNWRSSRPDALTPARLGPLNLPMTGAELAPPERRGPITRAFSDLAYAGPPPRLEPRNELTRPAHRAPPNGALMLPAEPYMASIRRWAREFELPQSLLLAVIHTESRFDPAARSHANAVGLMQLIAKGAGADAWRFITGERYVPTEAQLLDPDTNIRLGAAYLRMLMDHYWSHVTDPAARQTLVLASYNWGIGNVRRRLRPAEKLAAGTLHAAIERAAPPETTSYLSSVQQQTEVYEALLVASAQRLAAH